MGVSGIYSSVLQNYSVPTIPAVRVEDIRRQEGVQATPETGFQTYEAPSAPTIRKPDAAIEDISITFNRQEDFGYLGQDSDIHSLDVERAISDMQKDRMLQQYQYFVGSAKDVYTGGQTPDGIVIPKF